MIAFSLTVAKLDEVLFRGEAEEVILPSEAGEMAVLAHHMPLVALLKEGVVRVKHQGREESFSIKGGTVEINTKETTVLVR
ncbi:hypothetical protein K8Q93_03375 [Candidatus Parcubacteria bacterium]|nr:hypothetical protein [Candidatus Parcubacteria bacterium]